MKLMKFASLTLMTALVLGVYSAKAFPAIIRTMTTNYSKLNVSITVSTNSAQVVSGNDWKNPVHTAKIGNKQLLDLFAHWASLERATTVTWPDGAQLVIGWDWKYHVLVVDKTKTNVLYDAIGNYGTTNSHYFYLNLWYYYGVGESHGAEDRPGYSEVTDTGTAFFELMDNDYYLPYTDLWGYGGNKQHFKQSWDSNGTYTKWSDSEDAEFPYMGDQYYLNSENDGDSTSTADISASGHGNGENFVGWWAE